MCAAETLEDDGFDVLQAGNADDAMRILESRPDVRIIFTDIDMPGSMDGLKLAALVRGRWPQIEIFVTSGYRSATASDLPERCIFIPKPYKPSQLIALLQLA